MKIEIAESLIYSYLKHNEGCRFAQTNWTTSSKWVVTEDEQARARALYDKMSQSELFTGIFKQNSFDQLIKQAEIDVIGINTVESTIYGIDVAFHAAGLNYGTKDDTALRIVKKIFRTIFIMQTYFNEYEKFNSFFVTPKVNPATKLIIDDLIDKAKEIIDDDNIIIDFISNERFYTEIVDAVLETTNGEHDTTELFSRAVKLLNLDNRVGEEKVIPSKTKGKTKSKLDKRTVQGMKISQFVRHSFRKLYEQGLILESELVKLQNKEDSKNMFKMTFEILQKKRENTIDDKGHNRYYSPETFCGGYYLTSQWKEPHWDNFLDWLKKLGYDYEQNPPN